MVGYGRTKRKAAQRLDWMETPPGVPINVALGDFSPKKDIDAGPETRKRLLCYFHFACSFRASRQGHALRRHLRLASWLFSRLHTATFPLFTR